MVTSQPTCHGHPHSYCGISLRRFHQAAPRGWPGRARPGRHLSPRVGLLALLTTTNGRQRSDFVQNHKGISLDFPWKSLVSLGDVWVSLDRPAKNLAPLLPLISPLV